MQVVEAPAKLTRSLRITGLRADGYHLLDAEMVTLDLADELVFSEGTNDLPPDNLVSKALATVGREAHVRLTKRIPPGAGLGGGSADAAAVLRWAGCLDLAVAAGVGADVPFCLVGGRARVRGIGEVVEPLSFEDLVFTLLTPPLVVPTPEVYRAWDELGGPRAEGPNDLEPAALVVEPRLAQWRDRLAAATGRVPVLAGSGGTWFVEGAFPGLAGAVVTRTRPPLAPLALIQPFPDSEERAGVSRRAAGLAGHVAGRGGVPRRQVEVMATAPGPGLEPGLETPKVPVLPITPPRTALSS